MSSFFFYSLVSVTIEFINKSRWLTVILLVLPLPSTVLADEPGYQSNFRPGHHLTVLGGFQQTNWSLMRTGRLANAEYTSFEPSVAVRYGFHFNFLKKFGFVVGTSTQMNYDDKSFRGFRPELSYLLPTISLGIVQNFLTNTRASLHAEYGATWFPTLSVPRGTDAEVRNVIAAPITDTFVILSELEHFYTRNRAVAIVIGGRILKFHCLQLCKGAEPLGSLNFEHRSLFVQAGLTWHLGGQLTE